MLQESIKDFAMLASNSATKLLIWPNATAGPAVMSLVIFLSSHPSLISYGKPKSHEPGDLILVRFAEPHLMVRNACLN